MEGVGIVLRQYILSMKAHCAYFAAWFRQTTVAGIAITNCTTLPGEAAGSC